MRQTYTYAQLELSQFSFEEIKAKLKMAGYHHTFNSDETIIDMNGIGVSAGAPEIITQAMRVSGAEVFADPQHTNSSTEQLAEALFRRMGQASYSEPEREA